MSAPQYAPGDRVVELLPGARMYGAIRGTVVSSRSVERGDGLHRLDAPYTGVLVRVWWDTGLESEHMYDWIAPLTEGGGQ